MFTIENRVVIENSTDLILHDRTLQYSFNVSRYSSQTATERRAKRMPSCRQQETSREIDPVGKMRRVDLHV